jgi:NTE family protein
MMRSVAKDPSSFLFSLLNDCGAFPGYGVTRYFEKLLEDWVKDRYVEMSYNEITFSRFELITGVKLMISGTNISRNRPLYFCSRDTPDFPVGEAVAISINLPLLFKPIYVDADVNSSEPLQRRLFKGLWIDGGITNNLPVHAFDSEGSQPPVSGEPPAELLSLNPNVLALQLVGHKQNDDIFPPVIDYFRLLIESLFYQAEAGQIRSYQEEEQTIRLSTYDLETTDFGATPDKHKTPIDEARKTTQEYFDKAKKQRGRALQG